MPETGGNVEKVLDFVNITDPEKRLLLLVFILTCFIPDFPHTVLNIYGPAGSAKTSLSALLKKIIDPSLIEEDEFPRSSSEFAQKFSHNWLTCFGNVSAIPGWTSDLLCKAITGGGFTKRELYSDDEDVIYRFKRCMVINGISLVAAKSDLLERSILLELETIPANQRLREDVLTKKFEAEKASILGGIFTAVSRAMQIKDSIEPDSLPRMADFVVWGCAIAEVIGHSKEKFLQAYYRNISMQNKEVIFESSEAGALIELAERNPVWKGTPTQLLNELRLIAQEQKVDIEKNFSKNPNVLTRKLNLLKANLEQAGIKMWHGEENKQRIIYIQKIQDNIVSIDEPLSNPEGIVPSEDERKTQSSLLPSLPNACLK